MRNFGRHFTSEGIKLNDDGEPFIPLWTGFDLDGTLAVYDKWQGHAHVGAPILPMIEKVKEIIAGGGLVKIFTARVSCATEELNEVARVAIRAFL